MHEKCGRPVNAVRMSNSKTYSMQCLNFQVGHGEEIDSLQDSLKDGALK